jgi:hypothetical protein
MGRPPGIVKVRITVAGKKAGKEAPLAAIIHDGASRTALEQRKMAIPL